jgi:hypothetical protein
MRSAGFRGWTLTVMLGYAILTCDIVIAFETSEQQVLVDGGLLDSPTNTFNQSVESTTAGNAPCTEDDWSALPNAIQYFEDKEGKFTSLSDLLSTLRVQLQMLNASDYQVSPGSDQCYAQKFDKLVDMFSTQCTDWSARQLTALATSETHVLKRIAALKDALAQMYEMVEKLQAFDAAAATLSQDEIQSPTVSP